MTNKTLEAVLRTTKRIIEYGFRRKYYYKLPLWTRLKAAFYGFNTDEWVFYNLDDKNYKEYLTYFETLKSDRINGRFQIVTEDKLIFEEIVGKYAKVPTNYAWISNGYIYGLKDYEINNENVISFIKQVKICTLKIQSSCGGKGFHVIRHIEDDKFEINSKICTTSDVLKLILEYKKDGLLTEYIYQSDFSASLYPYSANTMRIVCARNKDERDFHLIAASQRIGNDSSRPVDNSSSGGIVCPINLNTGELGSARIFKACDVEHCIKKYEKHPNTNKQLKGVIIPNWNNLKEDILALTRKFPYLNFVAWDVLLTKEGFCIIEGNNCSALDLLQLDKGLRYSTLGDYYRSYGINSVNNIRIKKER